MKKYFLLLVFISLVLSACMEKDEIFPRPTETITIKITKDTIINFYDNQTFVLDAGTGDSSSFYNWGGGINSQSSSITITNPFNSPFLNIEIYTDTIHSSYFITFHYEETTMYFPNSFSPNGDGMNDYWSPRGINIEANSYLLKIYNKDDHVLYKTTDSPESLYGFGWDGSIEGTPCPIGYYYYVVKYKTMNGEKHKNSGMLQLIR
jgi:gliding motility-associated-like protein